MENMSDGAVLLPLTTWRMMHRQRVARRLLTIAKELLARDVRLVALIDGDTGRVVKKRGKASEGVGIFDGSGNEYAGGFTADGESYGSNVDSANTILLFNGKRSRYAVGQFYPDVV